MTSVMQITTALASHGFATPSESLALSHPVLFVTTKPQPVSCLVEPEEDRRAAHGISARMGQTRARFMITGKRYRPHALSRARSHPSHNWTLLKMMFALIRIACFVTGLLLLRQAYLFSPWHSQFPFGNYMCFAFACAAVLSLWASLRIHMSRERRMIITAAVSGVILAWLFGAGGISLQVA